MSAQTKGVRDRHTLTSTEGVISNDAPDILHVWFQADIDFSNQTGIEVRSLCGYWDLIDMSIGGTLDGRPLERSTRLCRSCTRTRAYRR